MRTSAALLGRHEIATLLVHDQRHHHNMEISHIARSVTKMLLRKKCSSYEGFMCRIAHNLYDIEYTSEDRLCRLNSLILWDRDIWLRTFATLVEFRWELDLHVYNVNSFLNVDNDIVLISSPCSLDQVGTVLLVPSQTLSSETWVISMLFGIGHAISIAMDFQLCLFRWYLQAFLLTKTSRVCRRRVEMRDDNVLSLVRPVCDPGS